MREYLEDKSLRIKDMTTGEEIIEANFFKRSPYTQECILSDDILSKLHDNKKLLIDLL